MPLHSSLGEKSETPSKKKMLEVILKTELITSRDVSLLEMETLRLSQVLQMPPSHAAGQRESWDGTQRVRF